MAKPAHSWSVTKYSWPSSIDIENWNSKFNIAIYSNSLESEIYDDVWNTMKYKHWLYYCILNSLHFSDVHTCKISMWRCEVLLMLWRCTWHMPWPFLGQERVFSLLLYNTVVYSWSSNKGFLVWNQNYVPHTGIVVVLHVLVDIISALIVVNYVNSICILLTYAVRFLNLAIWLLLVLRLIPTIYYIGSNKSTVFAVI